MDGALVGANSLWPILCKFQRYQTLALDTKTTLLPQSCATLAWCYVKWHVWIHTCFYIVTINLIPMQTLRVVAHDLYLIMYRFRIG